MKAQEFINGDLSGIITGVSSLPTSWTNVPYGDVNCLATHTNCATPDLLSYTQPDSITGLIGNPYAGSTFMAGGFASAFSSFWHEGIMQYVSGFNPGDSYEINFHQAVVKTSACLDSSGSWAVYVDTTLIGISIPTFSSEPFNSTSFIWEFRTLPFVATLSTHEIKFLPVDDDSLWNSADGVYMGIDCIYIKNDCNSGQTGIDSYKTTDQFTIYPNPITDLLNIETKNIELFEIILYDIELRKLLNQEFTNATSINMSHFEKGIYLFEVRNKNGVVQNGKILKD